MSVFMYTCTVRPYVYVECSSVGVRACVFIQKGRTIVPTWMVNRKKSTIVLGYICQGS